MGSRITSYSTLVSAVTEAMEDNSTEFADYLPVAIGLAEQRLAKQIDSQYLVQVTTATASIGDRLLPKPSGYRIPRDITTSVSSSIRIMDRRTKGFMEDYWPDKTSTSAPRFYGDYDGSNFFLSPTPDAAYVFTVRYEGDIAALTSANPTNAYTDNVPDALFYAVMSNMAEFMKHWDSVNQWEQKLQNVLEGTINEGRRSRRDDDTDPQSPSSGQNTLRGDN